MRIICKKVKFKMKFACDMEIDAFEIKVPEICKTFCKREIFLMSGRRGGGGVTTKFEYKC